jgi:hypothetical protein
VIIRAGYDIAFHCQQETPMVLMLSVHPSRQGDLLSEHRIILLTASRRAIMSTPSAISALGSLLHRRLQ